MAEFLIVLPVLLLLLFGTIQIALIFHAKITLNYAAFEAARAGSLDHAQYSAVREGVARGLAPLFAYAKEGGDQVAAFQRARTMILAELDGPGALIRIERLSPSAETFLHHAERGEIPNDNLLYRSDAYSSPASEPLQDANLLHIRVTYWYPLYVPFINHFIYNAVCCQEVGCSWRGDPACQSDDPRIPLTAVAAMRMMTPARESMGFATGRSGVE